MLRVIAVLILVFCVDGAEVRWRHLSSATNDLPLPSSAKVQSASVVGDFDGDKTNDFILAFADVAPALVLYRNAGGGTNWTRLPIELEFLPIARGGTALDIDKDDDLDVVFGSDTAGELWWWENPNPAFDSNKSWTRRTIVNCGSIIQRGQLFADLLGIGRPQLLFWNQGSNAVFHAEVPREVRTLSNWAFTKIFSPPNATVPGTTYSLAVADIDIDGNADLLAGNYLLKRRQALEFQTARIGTIEGRSAIGRFREGTYPQIVIAPHARRGPVFWYECRAHPERANSWAGRQLITQDIAPASSLAVGDINKDGNDDILLAEQTQPGTTSTKHAPNAWIFYSDGAGNFRSTILATDVELFEAKLVDLDNDSDLDILSTPHTAGGPRLDLWLNVTEFPTPVHPN
jgi:hypothetical protein